MSAPAIRPRTATPRDARRTVLMFAYYFPPCRCWPTASMRAEGLALGLSERRWEPVVVTRGNGCACLDAAPGDADADTRPRPAIEVRTVQVRPSLLFRASAATERWYGPVLWRRVIHRLTKPMRDARWLTERRNDWPRRAIAEGRHLARGRDVRAVWTTSGPYRSIAIGRGLQRRAATPWVADLRDSIARERVWRGRVDRIVGRRLRRRWFRDLRHASAVVGVSPQEAEIDAATLGREVLPIPSGFDPAAWEPLRTGAAPPGHAAFRILYAGGFYRDRIVLGGLFLDGLRRFVDRLPERPDVVLTYVGPHGSRFMTEAIEHGCSGLVEDGGRVSPARARERMIDADLLLLLTPRTTEGGMPGGKLYEYLAAGAPILAVHGTDPFVMGVLNDTGAGDGASTPDEIADVLGRRYEDWRLGRASRRSLADLGAFTWSSRGQRLAGILDAVAGTGDPGRPVRDPFDEVVA